MSTPRTRLDAPSRPALIPRGHRTAAASASRRPRAACLVSWADAQSDRLSPRLNSQSTEVREAFDVVRLGSARQHRGASSRAEDACLGIADVPWVGGVYESDGLGGDLVCLLVLPDATELSLPCAVSSLPPQKAGERMGTEELSSGSRGLKVVHFFSSVFNKAIA